MKCPFLYIVGQLRDGGLERQLCYLLQAMDRERYQPQLAVWNFRNDDKYVSRIKSLGVPIHCFNGRDSRTTKMKRLRSLVREIRPEVIHSYSFYTNFGAWYATVGRPFISIGSVRSDFSWAKSESGSGLGRLCARWPRTQIYNSFAAVESARRLHSLFVPRKALVVRNGIDLARFACTPLPNGSRTKIVAIGSLTAVKRWDRLLSVAFQLKQAGFDFVVSIVGDGPLRDPLEQQAKKLDITDRVEFMRRTDEVPSLLSQATFLVHTSDSEGCPNVVMEAMACGRPVVATDAGDTPSLIEDGKTGFVVRRGDDDALVRCISTLLSDAPVCRRMGEAGRAKAEKEFGLNRFVSETLNAYRTAGWKDE